MTEVSVGVAKDAQWAEAVVAVVVLEDSTMLIISIGHSGSELVKSLKMNLVFTASFDGTCYSLPGPLEFPFMLRVVEEDMQITFSDTLAEVKTSEPPSLRLVAYM